MITFKEDGTLKTITFYEEGWYDCCSGNWFISYHLLDSEGERVASYNNISECYLIALKIAERNSINSSNEVLVSVCQGDYNSEIELINLFDESTVVDVIGRELEHYGVGVIIELDESIDLSLNYRCTD